MSATRTAADVMFLYDDRKGEAVAVFSETLDQRAPGMWSGFTRDEQHVSLSRNYVRRLRPATAVESRDLRGTLDRIGYDVRPVSRLQRPKRSARLHHAHMLRV